MIIKRLFSSVIFACASALIISGAPVLAEEPDQKAEIELLGIGSPAPELAIEHWYGDPTLPTEIKFKTGHIYVVEFWATWCGPCIAGMPHLAELQKKLADKKVTIIGVSKEKPKTVNAFLKRPVKGNPKKTYAQLTSAYRLASDPDESTSNDYMVAAKQSGIPTAFIVGKTGLIEWVGHPGRMDEVLEKVISDTWDGKEEGLKLAADQQMEAMFDQFYDALEADDFETARKLTEQVRTMENLVEAEEEAEFMSSEIEYSMILARMKTDPDAATKDLAIFFGKMEGDSRSIFFLSADLIEMKRDRNLPVTKEQFKIVADACKAELEGAGIDTGILLNALGNLHELMGDRKAAEEFHNKAIAYEKTQGGKNAEWYQEDLDILLGKKQRKGLQPDEKQAGKPPKGQQRVEFSKDGLTIKVQSKQNVEPGGRLRLTIAMTIPPGHHIYGSKDEAQPAKITINESEHYEIRKNKIPAGTQKQTVAGPRHLLVGNQRLSQTITISSEAAEGDVKISGQLHVALCQDEACRQVELPFEITVTVASQQGE